MKISPVSFYNYKTYNLSPEKSNKTEGKQFTQFSKVNYRPAFLGQISYGNYKPVSLKKPNYDLLNCSHSNINSFSDHFAKKINSQLRTIELSDVQALYKRINIKTGADENLINNVLYQLTLYSNYNAVDHLQDIADKYNTNIFGMQPDINYQSMDVSSNLALNYLAKNKKMINKATNYYSKSLIVLDGIFLKELEYSKKQGTDFYRKFIDYIKADNIKILNLKGWDVKCSDNVYRSAAFLYGTGQLEDLAVDTIKRIQKGEKLDDILYGNTEEKLREIIGKDLKPYEITIEREAPEEKNNITQIDVFKNLQRPSLTSEDIHYGLLKTLGYENDFIPKLKNRFKLLTRYLDEFSVAYSFDTIALELIELKKVIEEKYGKNILYLMALPHKSGGFITHIFAKINNLEPNMFYDNKNQPYLHTQTKKETNYPTVVLDDISASGTTIERDTFNKVWTKYENASPYSFGLLAITNMTQNVFNGDKFKTGELIYRKKVKDLYAYDGAYLSPEEISKIKRMVYQGYNNTGASVVFPYLIPDNCTDLAAHTFKNLLIKDNEKTNKVLSRGEYSLGS